MSLDPRTPAERLVGILESLRRAVADHGFLRRIAGPLLVLIWNRLGRTMQRITRLAARQGKPTRKKRKPRTQAAPRPPRPKPPLVLPQGKAWLVRLIRETSFARSQLQYLLAQPDTVAWIAETPEAGRILRPLCRMVGLAPPPAIAKPPPRQPAQVAPAADAAATEPPPAATIPAEAATPPLRRVPRRIARPSICGPPAPA